MTTLPPTNETAANVSSQDTGMYGDVLARFNPTSRIIADAIYAYVSPFIWIFGALSNILILAVFLQKSVRGSLTVYLFSWLAVADVFSLFECGFNIEALHFNAIYNVGKWACGISMWLLNVTRCFSAWVLVGISIERLAGIAFPLHAKFWCTINRGRYYVLIVFVVSTIIYIPIIYMFEIVSLFNPIEKRMIVFCGSKQNLVAVVYPWISLVIYAFVPFFVLGSSNISIIILIKFRRQQLQSSSDAVRQPIKRSPTVMLILVSVAFILLTVPSCAYHIYLSLNLSWGYEYTMLNLEGWDAAVTVLSLSNHAVNLILYCLSGSKFRGQLKHLFC